MGLHCALRMVVLNLHSALSTFLGMEFTRQIWFHMQAIGGFPPMMIIHYR